MKNTVTTRFWIGTYVDGDCLLSFDGFRRNSSTALVLCMYCDTMLVVSRRAMSKLTVNFYTGTLAQGVSEGGFRVW